MGFELRSSCLYGKHTYPENHLIILLPLLNKMILSIFDLNFLGFHLFICIMKLINEPTFGIVMSVNELSYGQLLVE